MNHVKALIKLSNEECVKRDIELQSQLELGRNLNQDEENLLFSKYDKQQFAEQINKVLLLIIKCIISLII